ncbi:SDR family oxidoreductase [Castellaniella caeni]
MNHLTRTTAAQYAPDGVPINAVVPGLMKTPMVEAAASLAQEYGHGDIEAMWRTRDAQVPMGHMGDARDVAYAALFLASDAFSRRPLALYHNGASYILLKKMPLVAMIPKGSIRGMGRIAAPSGVGLGWVAETNMER